MYLITLYILFILFFIIGDLYTTWILLSFDDAEEKGLLKYLPLDPTNRYHVVGVGIPVKIIALWAVVVLPSPQQEYFLILGIIIGIIAVWWNNREIQWNRISWFI